MIQRTLLYSLCTFFPFHVLFSCSFSVKMFVFLGFFAHSSCKSLGGGEKRRALAVYVTFRRSVWWGEWVEIWLHPIKVTARTSQLDTCAGESVHLGWIHWIYFLFFHFQNQSCETTIMYAL
ncbi:hypothetical protein ILYODFUR_001873 [Ilyodon furcidens]|uniref:Secreted protein n=1 Tax=Ilyodon furcidens TaxID=33524 RepID=A0ABV0TIW4_9TELE